MSLWHRLTKFFSIVLMVGFITCFGDFVDAVGIAPAVLDVRVAPGQVAEQTITVVNTDEEARTLQLGIENFTPSETPGVPIFDGGARDEMPSWVVFSSSVLNLEPMESKSVIVKIAVPIGAVPGDYYGAVFVKRLIEQNASARTAALIFLTVDGNAKYGAELVSASLSKKLYSSSLFSADISAQNSGNVYVKPSGSVTANPMIGVSVSVPINPDGLRILPRQTRAWSVSSGLSAGGNFLESLTDELRYFAIGPVKATFELEAPDGVSDEMSLWYWVVPWRTLIILAGFTVMYIGFRFWMMKRINK